MAHTEQLSGTFQEPDQSALHPLPGALSRLVNVPILKPWQAYLAAVLAVSLATLLRWWLGSVLGPNMHPFVTYYPMIMCAALIGGTGPGLAATFVASLAVPYLFLDPPGIAVARAADQVGLALFVTVNVAVSVLCGALRSARHRTFAEARRAQASEERFRLFMDHTPTLAWIKDDRGRYTYLNKAYEQRFGRTLAECLGKTDAQLWPPDVAARLQKADQDALAAGHPIQLTEETTGSNGDISFWLNTKFAVRDVAGRQFIASIGLDITDRKRFQEAVEESEARLRLAVETAGLGMYERDLVTDQVILNPACRVILGATEPVPPDLARRSLHPEDRDRVLAEVTRAFDPELRAICSAEFRILRTDGTIRWVAGRGRVLFDDTLIPPRPIRFIGVLNDITEHKKTEEDLLRERASLETILQACPAGVIVADAGGKLLRMNPANERLWGLAPFSNTVDEYAEWKGWWADGSERQGQRLRPEDWAMARALRGEVCPGDVVDIEPFGAPGVRRTMINSAAPILSPSGQILGAVIAQMDITELRRTQQALSESEQRLRVFFDSGMFGALYWNTRGEIIAANHKFLQMLGYSEDDFRDGPFRWVDLTPPEYRQADERSLAQIAAQGFNTPYEKEFIRKDGSRIPVIIGAAAFDESRQQGVAFAIDNTERKQAEAEAQRARNDLARVNAGLEAEVRQRTARLRETVSELEHFSYTITHDMRAPLRAITGYIEILISIESQSLSHQGRDLLRRISESAVRMDQLITDALQYSRVVRDRFPLQPLDPVAAIRGIAESYPQFQPPHAIITIQPQMPRVLASQAGLTQVFSNLLGNAVKFVTPGQVPQITVTAETINHRESRPSAPNAQPSPARWVRICVADNGIGIPPEYQHKIWQMFQRLSKAYEGTGIGLALVRKVVERMGGRVGVESAPGRGSRFWVDLQKAPDT